MLGILVPTNSSDSGLAPIRPACAIGPLRGYPEAATIVKTYLYYGFSPDNSRYSCES